MKCNFVKAWTLVALLVVVGGCVHSKMSESTTTEIDTIVAADTVVNDSVEFFEEEDEGLTLTERTEFFSDFIYAFTHNGRFQAERIRFPLPVTDLDGTERRIRSGRQFRSEFQLPGNDYYVLLLGEREQMDIIEEDTLVSNINLQYIRLSEGDMTCYHFDRTGGKWFLSSREDTTFDPQTCDFLQFYERFTTDSVFQQESVAENIRISMDASEEDEEGIDGTIDRGQWPMFRPDMPEGEFICIDFGQTYPNPHRMLFLQCGISNGFMNIFTYRKENDRWMLTAYEN